MSVSSGKIQKIEVAAFRGTNPNPIYQRTFEVTKNSGKFNQVANTIQKELNNLGYLNPSLSNLMVAFQVTRGKTALKKYFRQITFTAAAQKEGALNQLAQKIIDNKPSKHLKLAEDKKYLVIKTIEDEIADFTAINKED